MSEQPEPNDPPFWRIRYRPTSFEEIKLYIPSVANQIQGFIRSKNIPHLLLVGPKGSGKTVLAEMIARELLTHEFSTNYKILFADDP
ncbi:MAG: AAA family ATPase, partial [Candidatus Heimdallarchaeota archaeon]|nr:AAA family ATPase [Candidatus Heimdallarchaeota archaeon]